MKVVSTIGVFFIIYGLSSFLLTSFGITSALFNNVNLATIAITLGVTIIVATKRRAKKKTLK